MQNLSSRSEPQPPAGLQILLLISALLESSRGFLVVQLRLLSFFSLTSTPPWQNRFPSLALGFHCGNKAVRRSISSAGPLLKNLRSLLSTQEWLQLCFPVPEVPALPFESTSSTSTPACKGTAQISPRAEHSQDLQEDRGDPWDMQGEEKAPCRMG